jgi:hypothetical protein
MRGGGLRRFRRRLHDLTTIGGAQDQLDVQGGSGGLKMGKQLMVTTVRFDTGGTGQDTLVMAAAHDLAKGNAADPDDCHHMAAAIAGGVQTIVTWNLADFPAVTLSRYGVTVTDPDSYLWSLLSQSPHEVMGVLARMSAGKCRPPMTVLDITNALDRAGVPVFARRIRSHLDPSHSVMVRK